eukprot:445818-Prymnesium_polylepis.1
MAGSRRRMPAARGLHVRCTTVISRRARRQVGMARLDGTSSSAARKAAMARAAATRRTAAAVIEYYGI